MPKAGFAAVFTVVGGWALAVAAPATAELAKTTDTFCGELQHMIMANSVPAATMVHADYASFRKSKAEVRPLRSEQFVEYEDAEKRHPMRVSCKWKSADIIVREYGEGAAKDVQVGCGELDRQIVAAAVGGFGDDEKAKLKVDPAAIAYDPDDTSMTGEQWVKPFPYAYKDAKGVLHLRGKQLRVDWNNKLLILAPDSFRGTLYCHLITPEYAKRLVLGEATPPPPPTE